MIEIIGVGIGFEIIFDKIGQNLVQDILDEPSLGLSGTLDSIAVELDREAAGIVPFSFSSQAIGEPESETDQIVTFQLEDVFVSAQGGTVADATIIIDQIDGLETFPDIVPVAGFVKDFLNNYDGENDFYQTISTNLSQALLDDSSLGLAGTLDGISVQLDRKPSGILPFQFIAVATLVRT